MTPDAPAHPTVIRRRYGVDAHFAHAPKDDALRGPLLRSRKGADAAPAPSGSARPSMPAASCRRGIGRPSESLFDALPARRLLTGAYRQRRIVRRDLAHGLSRSSAERGSRRGRHAAAAGYRQGAPSCCPCQREFGSVGCRYGSHGGVSRARAAYQQTQRVDRDRRCGPSRRGGCNPGRCSEGISESTVIGRFKQICDADAKQVGNHSEVVDRPRGPSSQPHRHRLTADPQGRGDLCLPYALARHPCADLARDGLRQGARSVSIHVPDHRGQSPDVLSRVMRNGSCRFHLTTVACLLQFLLAFRVLIRHTESNPSSSHVWRRRDGAFAVCRRGGRQVAHIGLHVALSPARTSVCPSDPRRPSLVLDRDGLGRMAGRAAGASMSFTRALSRTARRRVPLVRGSNSCDGRATVSVSSGPRLIHADYWDDMMRVVTGPHDGIAQAKMGRARARGMDEAEMSIERHARAGGKVRYRARVKWHGSHVASRMFDRRADAVAWHNDQLRRLQLGEWIDPRRGRVSLSFIAEGWIKTRAALKRRTAESDVSAWRLYIEPRFGSRPVNSFTPAEIREWNGDTRRPRSRAIDCGPSTFDDAVAISTRAFRRKDYDQPRGGCASTSRPCATRRARPGRNTGRGTRRGLRGRLRRVRDGARLHRSAVG